MTENHFTKARARFVSPAFINKINKMDIDEAAHSIEFVRTADDWQLALLRYSRAEQVRHKLPILFCHGLGCSHFSFDMNAQNSLVRELVHAGYDVYGIDLRSHGYSQKPKQVNDYGVRKTWGFGFNDYLNFDIQAAISKVLELSNAPQLHFLGHSMGGILLLAYAAIGGDKIRSGITFGSSLDYSGLPTVFSKLLPLLNLVKWLPSVPLQLDQYLSSIFAKLHPKLANKIYINGANIDTKLFAQMLRCAFTPVSTPVLEALACAISGAGMRSDSGEKYTDLLAMRGYDFDILTVCGWADVQCLPPTAGRFGTEQLVLGKREGQANDYGHHDLILGKNVHQEVYPKLLAFLDRHDA